MHPIIDEDEVKELKDFVKHRFAEIAETYLRCADDYVDDIVAAHGKNDAVGIVDAAHPLKSSSGNLGLKALSELARSLEEVGAGVVAGEKEFSELGPMVEQLPSIHEQSAEALKKQI
jgi:HPt (histidine-containing phosphotransfer) domain-containing protein